MALYEGYDPTLAGGRGGYALGSFQGGPDPNAPGGVSRADIVQAIMQQQGGGGGFDVARGPDQGAPYAGGGQGVPSGGNGAVDFFPGSGGGRGGYALNTFQGGPDMNDPRNAWITSGAQARANSAEVFPHSPTSSFDPAMSGFNSGNAMPGFGIPGDAGIPGSGSLPAAANPTPSGFTPSSSFAAPGPPAGTGFLNAAVTAPGPLSQSTPATPQPGGAWPSGRTAQEGPNMNDPGDKAAVDAMSGSGGFTGFGGFEGGGWGGSGFAGSGFNSSGDYSGGYDTAAGNVG